MSTGNILTEAGNSDLIPCVSTSQGFPESIDIYSKEGTKVRYTGSGGYTYERYYANKHLKVGEIYTIDHTNVFDYHTDVYLKEVPDKAFNSVHFVDAEPYCL